MRDLSDLVLQAIDFPALKTLCAADRRFPEGMASWDDLIEKATRGAHAVGLFPLPLMLDPHEFERWCQRGALIPSIHSLAAYAVARRGQVSHDSLAGRLGPDGLPNAADGF